MNPISDQWFPKKLNNKIKFGYRLVAQYKGMIGIYKIGDISDFSRLDTVNHDLKDCRINLRDIYHSEQSEHGNYWVNLTNAEFRKFINGKRLNYDGSGNLGFKYWEKLRLRITNKPYTEYLL